MRLDRPTACFVNYLSHRFFPIGTGLITLPAPSIAELSNAPMQQKLAFVGQTGVETTYFDYVLKDFSNSK